MSHLCPQLSLLGVLSLSLPLQLLKCCATKTDTIRYLPLNRPWRCTTATPFKTISADLA